jgi:hypothetical protein
MLGSTYTGFEISQAECLRDTERTPAAAAAARSEDPGSNSPEPIGLRRNGQRKLRLMASWMLVAVLLGFGSGVLGVITASPQEAHAMSCFQEYRGGPYWCTAP